MTGPAPAHADFERGVCTDVDGQITEITAAGAGLVAVNGSVSPRAADPATCDAEARLAAHAGLGDATSWYTDGEKGTAPVRTSDGQFAVGLSPAEGTFGLCLETVDGTPLDCYQVTVSSSGSGVASEGRPVVGGRITVHKGRYPPPPPCGHCM